MSWSRIIVKPKTGTKEADLLVFEAKRNLKARRVYREMGDLRVVEVPPGADLRAIAMEYKNSGLVVYVELDSEVQIPVPQ